jgi:sugar phosphate isomerase/epimerase
MTRRDFVKASAVASLATAVPSLRAQGSAAAAKRNPIALFSKHAHWLTVDEFGPLLREVGFDAVDLAVRNGGHVAPEQAGALLGPAVKSLNRAGLSVPMMVSGINDADHPLTETILRAAADAGIKHYRLAYYSYDPARGVLGSLDDLKPRVAKLAALNEKIGIQGVWQNHDGVRPGSSIWDMWYVIKDLDPKWLGVQFDPRHAVVEGGRSWGNDFDIVKDRTSCTVAKDFHWAKNDRGAWIAKHVPLGEGMVDLVQFYKLYAAAGCSGPISMHIEYPMFDRDEKTMTKAEKNAAAKAIYARELAILRKAIATAGLPA